VFIYCYRILKSQSSLVEERNEIFRPASEKSADSTPLRPRNNRLLIEVGDEKKKPARCDSAFMACLGVDRCVGCYNELTMKEIDWASVTPDTECVDVMKVLYEQQHCLALKYDKPAEATFCSTFKTCITVPDNKKDDADADDENEKDEIDCSTLEECDWPGFHSSMLGDGVCNENMSGCYNTEICDFDGGDCCEDTCEAKGQYLECGHDGYACRDPGSKKCDPERTSKCDDDIIIDNDDSIDPAGIDCARDKTLYRLDMYDSFGDGWDGTTLTITPTDDKNNEVFDGSLENGSKGTQYICLSRTKIKPYANEGAPSIAGGGAPMNCEFGVAGGDCKSTCDGKANKKAEDDPDYKEFKTMYTCMDEKCPIQVGICKDDELCDECFVEEVPDFCYAVDTFNTLLDCAICQCSDHTDSVFCDHKMSPDFIPYDTKKPGPKICSPMETLKAGTAVITFGKCTDLDEVGMIVTDFDENNFGPLDTFEFCAHSFATKANKGGHTALGCLQILVNAMNGVFDDDYEEESNAPSDAIAALAGSLYHDGESFCDCAKKASDQCPVCASFLDFKTLLYESLDACQALDEIDCDAWGEFHKPCKANIESDYGKVDFSKDKQCQYVEKGCGGAGPFPAFRRLDCGTEVSTTAWDFYNDYADSCLKKKPRPEKPPTPAPTRKPDPAPAPTPDDVRPSSPSKDKKPYVPPEDKGKGKGDEKKEDKKASPSYKPSDSNGKKSSHWFRNFVLLCLVGGGGYYVYKRRSDGFTFVRNRRFRNLGGAFGGLGGVFGGGGADDGMYSGLAMDSSYSGVGMDSSTSFEPPTLPPMPSTIGDNYYA
jgi:hypothetical protein